MSVRRSTLLFFPALLALVLLVLAGQVRAQTPPLRVVVAMPGPGAAPFLPVELIPRIGADRQAGIELVLRNFSGPLAAKDMLEKNSDFAGLALAAVGGLSLKHANLRSVVALTQAPAYTLMVRKDLRGQVRGIADLKGRSIGVHTASRSGKSTGQQLAEHLLSRSSIDLGAVNFAPAGSNETDYHAALVSGMVDAVMSQEPFASQLEMQGVAYRLVDLHDPAMAKRWLGGPYLFTQLTTSTELIEQQPEKARRLVKAVQIALKWIQRHNAAQIADALRPSAEARPALVRFLEKNKHMYHPSGAFSDEQIRTTERFFQQVAGDDPGAAQVRLADLIDARWAGRRP